MDNISENIPGQENIFNRISGLSPEKRALLIKRLRVRTENGISEEKVEIEPQFINGIAPVLREWDGGQSQNFPLTYSQQRLWIIDQLQPNLPVYNIPIAINLTGPINLFAIERSINEIIRRHEIFRTVFHENRGMPVQTVFSTYSISIPLVDLSHLLEDTREAVAMQMTKEEANHPLTLDVYHYFA